ncbi:hypothetical protein E4U43_002090 [Claviceps pusilla]|uniref:Uncharacterized protein n=1 Tax=Claviceps pusilla TaxID=123648 RepID=A0A9P7SYR4_9HYPO|nr:hypothetical protein E4U43_002090 [Claviceps pusilla]
MAEVAQLVEVRSAPAMRTRFSLLMAGTLIESSWQVDPVSCWPILIEYVERTLQNMPICSILCMSCAWRLLKRHGPWRVYPFGVRKATFAYRSG